MLVSSNWLSEWVEHDLPISDLANHLTMAGLEIESLTPISRCHEKIVVGQIIDLEFISNSSGRYCCKVNVGQEQSIQIIARAPTLVKNAKYPIALVGSIVNGHTVQAKRIDARMSQGMFCSENELGLGEVSDRPMELDSSAVVGTCLNDHLDLNDFVLDIGLTPNRADCLGIKGVSREIAILNNKALIERPITAIPATIDLGIPVSIEDKKDCPVYCGRLIKNIRPNVQTPDWMKEKLRRVGLRPIHFIVDVTNYVMIDLGQPMHAFDTEVFNSSKIVVRHAKDGEKLKLLDGTVLDLAQGSLLIADPDQPVGLAGVMGGELSGISTNTQNIFLEAAFFAPTAIRHSVATYGLHTDASHRFERGVDPFGQRNAIEYATQLILELAGGQPGPVQETRISQYVPQKKVCKVREHRIQRVLGLNIPRSDIENILQVVNTFVEPIEDGWNVKPPPYRFDLEEEHDQIEEVSRIFGYDKIPSTLNFNLGNKRSSSESSISESSIRELFHALGYYEVITYSFVDPSLQQKLKPGAYAKPLANPLTINMSVMRNSLFTGLLSIFFRNYRHRKERLKIYEIGRVFLSDQEVNRIGGLIYGRNSPLQWGMEERDVDFFDLKGDLMRILALTGRAEQVNFVVESHEGLHPYRCAGIYLDNQLLGIAGQIHPEILQDKKVNKAVYVFELDLNWLQQRTLYKYSAISMYPPIVRDLSILVSAEQEFAEIAHNIRLYAGEYLDELQLFDVYFGEELGVGLKSIAFRLSFKSDSRTLTDLEVDLSIDTIIANLKARFNANLRT